LQLMNTSGIRINCLVIAYMHLPFTWTKKDAMITKERRGCHEMANLRRWKVAGKELVDTPAFEDHITYSRKHGAVLSPTYT
jgi:hypothetical protein